MSFDVNPSPVEANRAGEIAGSVDWWLRRHELRARRKPRTNGLSLERITDEALRIADAEGIAALTMRRLADALGTGIASLYRHVASRDELIVEMTDHVLGELRPPSAESWRDGLEQLAQEARRILKSHPSVLPSSPQDQLLGPNAVRAREIALSLLVAQGFEPADAVEIYTLLVRHVIGSAILDGAPAHGRGYAKERGRVYATLPPEEFPSVSAISSSDHAPDDDQLFDFTLCAILDAVGQRYPRAAASAE
jgi:AcrR family transcriptional regulator